MHALRAKRPLSRFAQAGLAGAAWFGSGSWPVLGAGLVQGLLVAAGFSQWVARPYVRLAAEARVVYANPVSQMVYSGMSGEAGQSALAMTMLGARLRTALGRIREASTQVADVAQQTVLSMKQVHESVRQQHMETDQVAVALNEMSAASQEAARHTAAAANAARQADSDSGGGRQVVAGAVEVIDQLAQEFKTAAEVIHRLEDESDQIGSVLEVIRGIAEQTNLLAINAAIEAARAVDTISEMNTQIASAAEEQSAVTETLNRNVTTISQLSHRTSEITSATAGHSNQLMHLARNLESLILQCRA